MLKIKKNNKKKNYYFNNFFCTVDFFFIDKIFLIPQNIKIKIKNDKIYLKGFLGKVNFKFSKNINFFITYNKFLFILNKKKNKKKIIKLYIKLIKNNIKGISQGFKKFLIIKGLGFKFRNKNNKVELKLGFSHNIIISIPKKIKIIIKNNKIKFFSFDYILLTQFIYYLRSYKKKNYYKEKGLLFENEKIILKEGKKNKK